MRLPRRGSYSGRLAFDPETGYHTDPHGRHVVTLDAGQSWRYATKADIPHNRRYEQHKTEPIRGTDSRLLELALEHGDPATPNFETAHQILAVEQPHHYGVLTSDPHFGRSNEDPHADTRTGHTDAWKESA